MNWLKDLAGSMGRNLPIMMVLFFIRPEWFENTFVSIGIWATIDVCYYLRKWSNKDDKVSNS